MYEKDEDEGNVGFQFKMAAQIFREAPKAGRICNERSKYAKNPITNPIIKPVAHTIVDAGVAQFAGHEDVMAKLLGKI